MSAMLATVIWMRWAFTVKPATSGLANGPLDDATAIARVTEFLDADTTPWISMAKRAVWMDALISVCHTTEASGSV